MNRSIYTALPVQSQMYKNILDIHISNGQNAALRQAQGKHKVVCKLFLTVVYRSPFLISHWQGRPVGSLDLSTLTQFSKSLPSFVQHLFLVQGNKARHIRFACNCLKGTSSLYLTNAGFVAGASPIS